MFDMLPEGISKDLIQYAIIVAVIGLIIKVVFAYTLYSTLKLVKKENQCILPSQIWFVALPLFNIYWNFEVVRRLTDSLNNEFYDRQIEVEENPTRKAGQLFAWTYLLRNIPLPPFILLIIGMLHFVYYITYWIKVYQYKSLLALHVNHFGTDYTAKKEENEN